MEDNKRVLAFMAHPDDAELLCAGTLIRLHKLGYHVTITTMTNGDCGSMELGSNRISFIRVAEAKRSAALIGADYRSAGFDDFLICYDAYSIRGTVEVIRQTQPFMVIAHYPQDYMRDHIVASELVAAATFSALAPNLKTRGKAAALRSGVPYLYYAMPVGGLRNYYGGRIDMQMYVDISAEMPLKCRMLECHESQREWLRKHHGVDEYVEAMLRWCEQAGRGGCQYAEGFDQHLGHGYPQDNILQEILKKGE